MEENMDGEGGNSDEKHVSSRDELPAGHRLQRSSWRWVGLFGI